MKFTQLKYHKGRVQLSWIEYKGDQWTAGSINTDDEPSDEFKEAWELPRKHWLKLLGLPDDAAMIKRVDIHTINLSYKGSENTAYVVISGNIELPDENGSFNVNSPVRTLEEDENAVAIGGWLKKAVETIMNESAKFLKGDKKTLSLFSIAQQN